MVVSGSYDVLSETPAQRKILVLGDVSEPPGSQGLIYRDIGDRIAKFASHAVFIVGCFQRYAAGAKRGGPGKDSLINAKRSVLQAVESLRNGIRPGDVIFVKGRDTQRLERIAFSLMGRTVRCDISFCDTRDMGCFYCPKLEHG